MKAAIASPTGDGANQRGFCWLGQARASRSQTGIGQMPEKGPGVFRVPPRLGISKSVAWVSLSPEAGCFLQNHLAFCFLGHLPSLAILSFLVTPWLRAGALRECGFSAH